MVRILVVVVSAALVLSIVLPFTLAGR